MLGINPLKLATLSILAAYKEESYRSKLFTLPNGYFHDISKNALNVIFKTSIPNGVFVEKENFYWFTRRARSINNEEIKLLTSTYELCKLSLLFYVLYIDEIPKNFITDELHLIYLLRYAEYIKYIPKHLLTPLNYEIFINLNPSVIVHLPHISYNYELLTINNNSFILGCNKIKQTEEIQRKAAKSNGLSIFYFSTQVNYDYIYKNLITINNFHNYSYFDFYNEIYKLAVINFGISIKYVPVRYRTDELYEIATRDGNCKLAKYLFPHNSQGDPINFNIIKKNLTLNTHEYSIKEKGHNFIRNIIDLVLGDIFSKTLNLLVHRILYKDNTIRKIFYIKFYNKCMGGYICENDIININDTSFLQNMATFYPSIYDEYY